MNIENFKVYNAILWYTRTSRASCSIYQLAKYRVDGPYLPSSNARRRAARWNSSFTKHAPLRCGAPAFLALQCVCACGLYGGGGSGHTVGWSPWYPLLKRWVRNQHHHRNYGCYHDGFHCCYARWFFCHDGSSYYRVDFVHQHYHYAREQVRKIGTIAFHLVYHIVGPEFLKARALLLLDFTLEFI